MEFSPFLTVILAFSAAAIVGLARAAYMRDRPVHPNGHPVDSGNEGVPAATRGSGPKRARRRPTPRRAA